MILPEKKFFPSLFYLMFIFTSICLSSRAYAAQEFYPFLAEVTADDVHIRAGQSENFESLQKVSKKDELIVLDKSYSWYKIELPPQSKSYVAEEFVLKAQGNKGIITANRLNIRGGPGSRYTVLGQLTEGEEVEILGQEDGWFQIRPVKNMYGWVNDAFLNFKSKDVEAYRRKNHMLTIAVAKVPVSEKAPVLLPPPVPAPEKVEEKILPKQERVIQKEDISDLRKKIVEAMQEEESPEAKTKIIVKKNEPAEAEIKEKKVVKTEAPKIENTKKVVVKEEKKEKKTSRKEAKKEVKKEVKEEAKKESPKEVKKDVKKEEVVKKVEPPVDRTLVVWDEFKKLKKVKKNDLEYVSVKGYIQPQNEMDSKDVKYKFLINEKPVFYIQGFKHILEEFVNFQVELEGSVVTETQIKETYPIVEIHRIQLVL